MLGQLTLADEQKIVDETHAWLKQMSETVPAYRMYLERWGDWRNPWSGDGS